MSSVLDDSAVRWERAGADLRPRVPPQAVRPGASIEGLALDAFYWEVVGTDVRPTIPGQAQAANAWQISGPGIIEPWSDPWMGRRHQEEDEVLLCLAAWLAELN